MNARRWTILSWLTVVLACAGAAWLFLPRVATRAASRPRLVVVLVDASASVARASDWLPWVRGGLRGLARASRDEGSEIAVISFADGVATGFAPGDPARFLELLEGRNGAPFDPSGGLARGATRLADALRMAEPMLLEAGRPTAALELLGPMSYTGASPTATLARLGGAGVSIRVHKPPAPAASDLGLSELVVSPRVEAGAPLVALARLQWHSGSTASGQSASLELEVECDGSRRRLTRELFLPAMDGAFELPVDCGPAGFGRNVVRARCRLSGGNDLMPENDRARASALADGARVLGVVVRPELRARAEAWLAPAGRSALAGLQFLFLAPHELPAELAGLAAVVSFDLTPGELHEHELESFVLRGGGWLALSGYHFLEQWVPGDEGGRLHRLLPCEPEHSEAAPRDVVLLIDGSGSMQGEPFETVRAAALELVAGALPSDRVSLRFFTTSLELEHVLKPRTATRAEDQDAARRAARALLALRVPSGTTHLLRSLREFAVRTGEHEALALLLSDGRERDALPDPIGLAESLTRELQAARVRLVVIAVGDPNLPLLATLAGGPERIRSGRTLDDLRDVFHAELHGPQLAEGVLALHHAPRAPGSLADEVAAVGAGGSGLPALERYVRNRLRPLGEALWQSEEGEPVLALARAGLGRVALFASLPAPGWGAGYVRAGLGEPAEFEGLLRWLARGPERGPDPRARLEDGWLRVRGLTPETPALLEARLRDLEQGGERVMLLPPSEPGADVLGMREARLGVRVSPDAILSLALLDGSQTTLAVERALPEEFAWRERRVSPDVWAKPPVAPEAADHGQRSSPAAPWAIALALLGLLGTGWAAARGQGVRPFGR